MKTKKHNHTLTNILKVFVFSLMILMPFIIFIPNAFYYGFNESAVAQEKTEQVPVYYESNVVNTPEDLLVNHIYYYSNDIGTLATGSYRYLFSIVKTDNLYFIPSLDDVTTIYMYITDTGYLTLRAIYENNTNRYIDISSLPFNFVIESKLDAFTNVSEIIDKIHYTDFKIETGEFQPLTTNMSITDSMSYAWKSTWENDLFSWTETTAIYSGINATTTGIGISENSYIANYLAYIFLLTIIYVIIDIILGVFTMLTHIFNKEPK